MGPWIVGVVVIAVMLIFWIFMNKEDILQGVEKENMRVPKMAAPRGMPVPRSIGEPAFPGPVQQAALGSGQALSLPVQQTTMVAPINQPATNPADYSVAAITKATPYGNMQLIANRPTDSVFQNSLKDAVNAIIPCVCDIHARWGARIATPQAVDAQNMKFVPPFSGVIDKFVENKGYENIGAGIFVDQRGYVLTNYHVTQEATDVIVTTFGVQGTDYRADVVAIDQERDLALIKLRADGPFPEARLADSSFSQIGDYVIAVGSPFGIEQTVTSGIISGIRKAILIEGVHYQNLFQIDAPINRGSSGGPLVNLRGDVIGINTAIYAPTGVFSGTGFSIPINDVKDFLSVNLGRNYTVAVDRRGMIAEPLPAAAPIQNVQAPVHFGIEILPVNSVIAAQFGLPQGQGVLVNRVIEDSPANLAGILRGDIVTSIAGVPITGKEDVPKIISHFKSGDRVNVRIFRNGATNEILIKLL